MTTVLDRFLRYVRYDTQSDETSTTYPEHRQAAGAAARSRRRAAGDRPRRRGDRRVRLRHGDDPGDHDASRTCRRSASSPTSTRRRRCRAPASKPIVHRGYDGRDLVLPDDPTAVLRLPDIPALAEQIGHDIVTASGTTLLGADNKAGVAEIVTAAAYLVAHPEIPHGTDPHRLHAGRGSRPRHAAFRRRARSARNCAYTMDGGSRGEIEIESFSADAMTVTFHGFNTHPGYAKGRHGERHQGGGGVHRRAAARQAVAGDDRRPRGLRPPLRRHRRASSARRSAAGPRFRDRGAAREGSDARSAGAARRPPAIPARASRSRSRSRIAT